MSWKRQLTTILLISITLFTFWFGNSDAALAVNTSDGVQLFSVHCAGCHPKGGNIIRRGKTLKQRALQRNNLDSLDAVKYLVENGKNNMPAYKERLTPKEIEAVSAYVIEQAATGWRS